MLRGIKGTYVYVCNKELREYFSKHIAPFKTEKQINIVPRNKIIPYYNSIPLIDLKAAAGAFSDEQIISDNSGDYEWIELPAHHKPSKDLFACTVVGESMNRVIPNGSICLFRRYSGGSRNGKIVLVESSSLQDPDFGSRYTVKEYHSKKNTDNESWHHTLITLKPLSYDAKYADIVIGEDELIDLKVIGVFEAVL